ncbi:hypothetical protein HZS_3041 [Henneguya salminicola]|nr:hypothetical protein HZS_3041 [Henneguya salminicola]
MNLIIPPIRALLVTKTNGMPQTDTNFKKSSRDDLSDQNWIQPWNYIKNLWRFINVLFFKFTTLQSNFK